ncbi:MAG: tRNA preQ1(34) S-adenosylmethionine ribosyltransferase-isomerase QueA, partial [Deltaproteobacteria bacterium]
MNLTDFDYFLPQELIAQYPIERRDESRLMVIHRDSGAIEHKNFPDIIGYLKQGDLLVLNDTKVMCARLIGKKSTGGRAELLLISRVENSLSGGDDKFLTPSPIWGEGRGEGDLGRDSELWRSMVKPEKGIKAGVKVFFADDFFAEAIEKDETGCWVFRLVGEDIKEKIRKHGKIPLPPYIRRDAEEVDKTRYQTIFAKKEGAIAAPTAGLHFTDAIFEEIKKKGALVCYVTLHTGPATFLPVRDMASHKVPAEHYIIGKDVSAEIIKARKEKRRVVAVGSTVTRTLEAAFLKGFENPVLEGATGLFITPGFQFKVISALITNFHLPKSSLLMMVSAFAGKDLILKAYKEAVEKRYRFFSYG